MEELTPRMRRERITIDKMIGLYCRENHDTNGALCVECARLQVYTHQRLEKCAFGSEKPTCANCPVHCYQSAMREKVRTVMRYSGPRMLIHHPLLTVRHLLDGRRPAPRLKRRG
ncbi:MAG TPA: nitrous oxide-stimulated promoter family protein [Longilinea sp.]|nr:nitrous oxide-stimulated promoter family protein [Longilinea sp.]